MFVVADSRLLDPEVVEQLLCLAGVFAGDDIGLFQHTQSAKGDVLEIADRSGNKVESRHERPLGGHRPEFNIGSRSRAEGHSWKSGHFMAALRSEASLTRR